MAVPESSMPRVALVTGGAKRIGRAIALMLGDAGWDVAVHFHASHQEADAVVAELKAKGRRATALEADLMREDEVASLVDRARKALGPLGCVVSSASRFERAEARTATRESWDRHIETNLRAPFVLMQGFARALPAESSGAIVNILDERVWNLTPHFTSYTLAKPALWTLTRTMALALAPRIRVNGIGPGPTLPSPRQSAMQFARQSASVPLGHGTSPEEIARAVLAILALPAMTGQMLALDGGQHLQWHPARQAP